METILQQIKNHQAIDELIKHKERFANVSIEQEAILIASSFAKKARTIVVIKPNLYNAQQLYEKIYSILTNKHHVFLYSQEDSLRVEEIAQSSLRMTEKMEAISRSLQEGPKIVVTHVGAVIRKIPKREIMDDHILSLKEEQVIEYDKLIEKIQTIGYNKTLRVDQPLLYANRGNIIDVFDIAYDYPIRIEFFDNVIESIRFFDVHTQRTIKVLKHITLYPVTDLLWTATQKQEMINMINGFIDLIKDKKDKALIRQLKSDLSDVEIENYQPRLYVYYAMIQENVSIIDYLNHPQVIVSNIEQSELNYLKIIEENSLFIQERFEQQSMIDEEKLFIPINELIHTKKAMLIHQFQIENQLHLPWHSIDIGTGTLNQKLKVIKKKQDTNRIIIGVSSGMLHPLIEALLKEKMPYVMMKEEVTADAINIMIKELEFGFEDTDKKMLVISERELFQTKRVSHKYGDKFREAEVLSTYDELKEGDFIVHREHGIGKYLGIVNKSVNGFRTDYLHIAYRDEAKLFIPLEQFQLVRKFVSMEGIVPRLNKLGTTEWQKTKQKVAESVSNIAEYLLNLYSEREKNIGFAYSKDGESQKQFEEEFSYELTDDQAIATSEIKADMESSKPMDRLLCGDVGFGKTEVAMRAAFKAVNDNKQVAFLCPTTILSFQHMKTFTNRFKNHAINIQVLNRFVLPSKQQKIIRDVKAHKVDILIGTHRLLSDDIKYDDLGLLIIDEEQRFGVEHKEKIKQLKSHIDVLSLSATPIPRTLQMSLIGLRSLSQLNTPPQNRMPIQTYVVVKNRLLIKEIIERELSRKGQVFYLFNQIDRIYEVATQIQHDIPGVSVGVAHGRMSRDEIEDVMFRFMNNEYQVLVCTTIIETGIDIPNANTMIIDQAENFGLSQLYQIRGRVGRSDRVAYTYLMYHPKKQLTEIATKRLQAIKEFTQLGSGYKIAMRDLTIRGAGDMLGDKQSGFINTVGMDMYIELLKEAIAEKKNMTIEKPVEQTPFNVQVEAYIPKSFADEDLSKITIYQEIQKINSLGKMQLYYDEIVDNYGKLPVSVEMLFEKKRLEILLKETRIETFKERMHHVECTFTQEYSQTINGIVWFELVNELSSEIQLKYQKNKISIHIKKQDEWVLLLNKLLIETKKEKYHAHR